MSFFNKVDNNTILTQRQILVNKFNSSRSNILLVIALSVFNIILLVTNANTYFLFSAYIPFFLVDVGMLICGLYPSEYYEGTIFETQALPKEIFVVAIILAVIILVLYLLSWIFSKKPRIGWLIFALVLFSIDTIAMLLINGFVIESILDYVIHGWVLFSLVKGILVYRDLKKLPDDDLILDESDDTDTEDVFDNGGVNDDSFTNEEDITE